MTLMEKGGASWVAYADKEVIASEGETVTSVHIIVEGGARFQHTTEKADGSKVIRVARVIDGVSIESHRGSWVVSVGQ